MYRTLTGVIVAGAVIIAGIGFAGSYAAVRELALKKGFGHFSYLFPIGIDAGICVLLALDLLLTWTRIPFPLLRQTAWLLTAATITFNGAAAWPDPLGVSMHAVIPILFVVAVEAARHAIGRIADITADKHMEGVRPTRWFLSPLPTFLLWRRMKLWELRSYEQAIKLEQERLIYQAQLRSRYGRAWRRKAPVQSLIPLKLARYGIPLTETAPAGLAAAGLPPNPHAPPSQPTGHTSPDTAAPGADTARDTPARTPPTEPRGIATPTTTQTQPPTDPPTPPPTAATSKRNGSPARLFPTRPTATSTSQQPVHTAKATNEHPTNSNHSTAAPPHKPNETSAHRAPDRHPRPTGNHMPHRSNGPRHPHTTATPPRIPPTTNSPKSTATTTPGTPT
ncbi:DUF2637 domain-containing protein [Streptomyces sp. NBC_00287]|uniref:DUF2637 domain-containing protein n=1 Tax=Streptomyces sp. NBC_00287 TaxID=2975702 RepID=UPI002E2D9F1D|nr:DUF2637 domain-containing protein [Streptomyces sp. NBC_00287]